MNYVDKLIQSIERWDKPASEQCKHKECNKFHMVYGLRDGELMIE